MKWFSQTFQQITSSYGGKVSVDALSLGAHYLVSTFEDIKSTIQLRDPIRGGLALWIDNTKVLLSPYNIRLLCSNGMMTVRIDEQEAFFHTEADAFEEALRHHYELLPAITDKCARNFRLSQSIPADSAFWEQAVLHLKRLNAHFNWDFQLRNAAQRERKRLYRNQRKHHSAYSRFEIINAITALARNENNPRLRMQMERLGGQLLMNIESEAITPIKTVKNHLVVG